MTRKTETYLFIRADGFYPMELENDAAAKTNAEYNPGTLQVETPDGKVIWQSGDAAMPNVES